MAAKVNYFGAFFLTLYLFSCRWFKVEHNATTKQDDWIYTGGYWDRNYNATDISLF